ncbi:MULTISPECIES: flagellar hook-associated family protein [Methylobacterium]|jgi:flagellar hook-associated protein 3 FlgL|uniref:flagellar hook-associated family protein n=1 Tax=Methylobacterium TaxID=407 RepID=UPI0008EB0C8D|nr:MULTISPECIES: flagellar hook-associated family protein [Methylobacterium]MBZ6414123.1 flagellar hook-associated family protein [Methylobacterium sp.]MBK3397459.1 flagellar hook-associated family protein [Methylobacterium ajmalii]MBK3409059.1 flagellar hook-associated family protein [Methylobacterium ajmalii]MBK3421234.1 flagellar hook-associated family protein [Methylobacterium ajmalii]SFF62297.1 flagellar hook-associated protein 3 FlgL [Methylobacterium sp. yr596]
MMTTSYISSLSLWNLPRSASGRLQAEIANATKEIADGRYADVGLAIGGQVGRSLSLRQSAAEIAALKDGNGLTASRINASQANLQQMQKAADARLATLTGLPADQRVAAMAASADDTLATLTGLLNATSNGQSLFSGTNTGASPIRDGAAAAAKTNAVAAFQSAFGFPPSDARTADLTAAQIQGFLEGTVAAQFADPNWGTTWSQASSTAITSRISLTETVTTSVGANETAFRQLAEAALVSSLGMTGLSAEAQAVVSNRAMSLLSKGSAGLVSLQADLGRAQARITDANARLDAQSALVTKEIAGLEAVDPAEAKTRLNAATTQLQMSYSLTAQLQGLSLLKYIS